MKKSRFLWLFVLLAVTMSARADLGGFYYKNFRVDAVVHQDNVWDITETIDVFFEEPRHGIYRYIPLTFKLQHDVSLDEGNEPKMIQSTHILTADGRCGRSSDDYFYLCIYLAHR